MAVSLNSAKVLFVSTFPPVKCGIASFTQDLINAINYILKDDQVIKVCALENHDRKISYNFQVCDTMNGHDLQSCMETAEFINQDKQLELVVIEHEFGLYGGETGNNVLAFLEKIEVPFIARFHTVLPSPDKNRLHHIQTIAKLAGKLIVMTKNSARILVEDYNIDKNSIIIIPHGTHNLSTATPIELKHRYNLDNKLVLTTFGLLSPNKGIEKGILAMKEVRSRFPNAIYIVLGLTHPNLVKQEGEKYREFLQTIIEENNLQSNVRLINEYVPTKKLMEYLALTDIYLFTSRDPLQAVSGTFLYAMSAGCPIISNSFVLAKEMLDEETGIIIEPGNEHELASNAIELLQNRERRKRMGHNAFLRTRSTTWDKVGTDHIRLFEDLMKSPLLPAFVNNTETIT